MFRKCLFPLTFLLFFCGFSKFSLASHEAFLKDPIDEYIVVLEDEPSPYHSANHVLFILEELEKKVRLYGGRILHSYSKVFFGAHVHLPASSAALLKQDSWVKFIAKNDVITLSGEPQAVISWGLDRIDQKEKELDDAYVLPYTGKGVHTYVVDTGLRASHEEFEGRVGKGFSSFGEEFPAFSDCNGHGTHVAGTVLGTEAGVAREAIIHPVRVFKCLGGTSLDVILSGMEWVVENHEKPAVMNMSLGGAKNEAWNLAVKNAVSAGITVVVAAGNSNQDACKGSPSGALEAITVAASTRDDELASFSSWGECVDIVAPGVDISSASRLSDEAFVSLNGTSMASPHVAGAVALLLEKSPNLSPSEVSTLLKDYALKDLIEDSKGSPNLLLHVSGFYGYPRVLVSRDQLIRLPKDGTIFLGQAQDYDGRIIETQWNQVFGPSISVRSRRNLLWKHELNLKSLTVGDYGFRFTVSDDGGYTLSQDTYLSVRNENTAPVADAGYETKISSTERLLLDATKSYDRDGEVVSYTWRQLDGPSETSVVDASAPSTRVDGTVSGTYRFRLVIKDDEDAVARDTVAITVNYPPLVEAGEDQFLESGTTSTVLKGSLEDQDGLIAVSLWAQRSGPSDATIVTEYDTEETEVTGLEEGTYVFELIAMDDSEDIVRDTMSVVVKGSSEEPVGPKVSAGDDQTITLPDNATTLMGTCEAREGICVSTSWSLLSSTARGFKPPKEMETKEVYSNLHLKNLRAGVYTFRFTGKDVGGNENSDDVVLTVLAE